MPVDVRLTYEDYCLLPDDGKRYEIIDGELFMSPSPGTPHQLVLGNLLYYLTDFVKRHDLGRVFVAPFDVVFSRHDVVEPDILYISDQRSSVLTEKNVQGAPDLVVEVRSESTADIDRGAKLKLYARFGVTEYWIVDPEGPTVEIYRRQEAGFELAGRLDPKDALASPLFPGFSLPLVHLLE